MNFITLWPIYSGIVLCIHQVVVESLYLRTLYHIQISSSNPAIVLKEPQGT